MARSFADPVFTSDRARRPALPGLRAQNQHMREVLIEAQELLGVEETGERITRPISRLRAELEQAPGDQVLWAGPDNDRPSMDYISPPITLASDADLRSIACFATGMWTATLFSTGTPGCSSNIRRSSTLQCESDPCL
jgi:hypothetical protein